MVLQDVIEDMMLGKTTKLRKRLQKCSATSQAKTTFFVTLKRDARAAQWQIA